MNTKLSLASALVVACCAFQAGAGQFEQQPYGYKALVQICTETRQDDRLGLKKALKEHRIRTQAAVDKVVCNGLPLISFARAEQSFKVVKMLSPYERRGDGHVDIKDIAAPN